MIRRSKNIKLNFLLLSLFLAFSVSAQTGKAKTDSAGDFKLKVTKSILKSKLMERKMPYNLILPKNYDDKLQKDTRYPVIYLIHGLFGHYDDWAKKTDLSQYAADYNYIIVMPEGDNGWHTDSATVPNDKYESYIVKELIPEIDKDYRTLTGRDHRAIAGLSMGGYGSLKFGLKYPEMFTLVGSFSGAVAITEVTDKNSEAWVSKSVMSVYGDAESETRKNNDVFKLVKEMSADEIKNLPFIYLDCGTEDFLIQSNRQFLSILQEKKIPHEYRELPGVHDWKFWDSQVQEFLELSGRFFEPKSKVVVN